MFHVEWLTPELQASMATNTVLGPRLADPKFAALLEEFQKDPQESLRKHSSNPEMRGFLQEFCRVMGEHFTKLGEAQEHQAKAAEADESDILRHRSTRRLDPSAPPVQSKRHFQLILISRDVCVTVSDSAEVQK